MEAIQSPPANPESDDEMKSPASYSSAKVHPILAAIAQSLNSLQESQDAMLNAITRVNAIREKLFSKEEILSINGNLI